MDITFLVKNSKEMFENFKNGYNGQYRQYLVSLFWKEHWQGSSDGNSLIPTQLHVSHKYIDVM